MGILDHRLVGRSDGRELSKATNAKGLKYLKNTRSTRSKSGSQGEFRIDLHKIFTKEQIYTGMNTHKSELFGFRVATGNEVTNYQCTIQAAALIRTIYYTGSDPRIA